MADNDRAIVRVQEWDHHQRKAAVLLAAGFMKRRVAEEVNISERQLHRWVKQPGFTDLIEWFSGQLDLALHDEASGMLMEAFQFYRMWLRGEVDADDERVPSVERLVLQWLKNSPVDVPAAGGSGPATAIQFNVHPGRPDAA